MVNTLYRACATMLPIALEGLPVSSSGHVLLCAALIARLMGASVEGIVPTQLDHLVHLPIAIVVALFFFPRWYYLLTHITRLWQQFFKIIYLGFITVAATALIYFLFQHVGTSWFPLWFGFACTAALLFSLRLCGDRGMPAYAKGYGVALRLRLLSRAGGEWTVATALILGAAQGLALLPGISRLGITYVIARWLGMRSQKAFELSFLIEWPISVAGFAKGLYDMHKSGGMHLLSRFDILAISIASVLAFAGLWLMQGLITTDRVWQVGWYVACLAVGAFMLGV